MQVVEYPQGINPAEESVVLKLDASRHSELALQQLLHHTRAVRKVSNHFEYLQNP